MAMKYYAPTTLDELGGALAHLTEDSKITSGGTDLVIKLNQGTCEPDALLYLGGVEGLKEIKENGDAIEIGAAATMTELAAHPLLSGYYAALAQSADDVGAAQIRNSATIGGNVANASPAGDLSPVLYLFEAEAVVTGPGGITRRLPVSKLLLGPGRTALSYNEAITRFILPRFEGDWKSAFVKLGFRKKLTISRIGLAIRIERGGDGIIRKADVVAGAVSIVPVHVEKAERALIGRKLDGEAARLIGQHLSDLIMEITPEHFDRDYKVGAAFGVAEDVCARLYMNERER